MEETLDQKEPSKKIYRDSAFWVGTFLGGPLVAGYLFAENFKALGQREKVQPTWIITIIVCIVIFGGLFLLPENINLPNQVIPFAYTAVAFFLFKKYQEDKAKTHIVKGGSFFGWGRVIAVSIIGLLLTVVPIVSFALFSDTMGQANIASKTYGNDVKHEIEYDQGNITEEEVDRIADAFWEIGYFDYISPMYAYVDKNGNTYEIYIAFDKSLKDDVAAKEPFYHLRAELDDYFPNHDVVVKLVHEHIDNVVVLIE